MIHREIPVRVRKGEAVLETYFLDGLRVNPIRRRPTVIICPGGGYEELSDREGEPVAVQMNAMGFHACVLKYSVKPAVFPQALLELAQAVRLVRERAKEWNADAGRIIVCGFSAGGHLACSLGAFWQEAWMEEALCADRETFRPDGLILCYPVVTSGAGAHKGSVRNLSGGDEAVLRKISLERQVTGNMPPVFLWHTWEDAAVPAENSLLLAGALYRAGISLELHIYPKGPHGLSLASEETGMPDGIGGVMPHCQGWIELAGEWVRTLGA